MRAGASLSLVPVSSGILNNCTGYNPGTSAYDMKNAEGRREEEGRLNPGEKIRQARRASVKEKSKD